MSKTRKANLQNQRSGTPQGDFYSPEERVYYPEGGEWILGEGKGHTVKQKRIIILRVQNTARCITKRKKQMLRKRPAA